MEIRQLEAFLAVADDLHFKRAAERMRIPQPTLSDLVRRLERELDTPLFTRTTRRVALTEAGVELAERAREIIESASDAGAAVRRIAEGRRGTVRLGIAPPVALVLLPHLAAALAEESPEIKLLTRRMWSPDLQRAIPDGEVDVTISCGSTCDPPGISSEVFCAEPLIVGVRTTHRLAGRDVVTATDLAGEALGVPNAALYPGYPQALLQSLDSVGLSPPAVDLVDIDFSAPRWTEQGDVDWILTTAALAQPNPTVRWLRLEPRLLLPYTLQWCPIRATTVAVGRWVNLVLTADVPTGWVRQSDHLGDDGDRSQSADRS